MQWQELFGGCVVISFLAGCNSAPPAEYAVIAPKSETYRAVNGSTNAYDTYVTAGAGVERLGTPSVTAVTFSAKQHDEAVVALMPFIKQVTRGVGQPCTFTFSPHGPFEATPYRRGWRLLGRALTWNIQDALAQSRWDDAINATIVGSKFGFDLTGGDASDATLGLLLVDGARKAIAPFLERLDKSQLNRLQIGMREGLTRRAPTSQILDHEQLNMAQAIQILQDNYRDHSLTKLSDKIGMIGQEPFKKLSELYSQDSHKRSEFFQELLTASAEETAWLKTISGLPAMSRSTVPAPEYPKSKRWKGFVKLFFGAGRPVLGLLDATVARTRLMILELSLLELHKSNQPAPQNLNSFADDIKIDPYSGKPFMYRAVDGTIIVYSVGENGRDDGGDSDESFSSPDLKLETR